ncbi:aminotransferase A [Sporosarcina siberiensis]|uniref:Aminotransferase n=1 Tax=Sporosarcina siberiensis TaxID=1365606 RepID=A0ABW4SGD2_9BACL
MKHLLNKRVQEVKLSPIRLYSQRISELKDGINLTIGQPDFFTPEHIKEAGKRAIDENKTSYTNTAGIPELRKAASKYVNEKYNLSYNWEDEVLITTGATQALDIVLRTILEEGCEVILPGPVYLGYHPLIQMCGAVPVFVDTTNNDFKMTADLIEKKLTPKTRCVILSYPSNPVGAILNKEELEEIGRLLKGKDIFIVSDEIYSELNYEEDHYSIAAVPELKNQSVVINGLSKSHSMTGWRIGLLFAPAYLISEAFKVQVYSTTCASSISQYAALEALTNGFDDPLIMKKVYQKRRDYVYSRLASMGFDVSKPKGAFYIFPSVKKFSMTSTEFADALLEKEHVAVVPGSAFSELGEGYIRISFAYSMEILEEGLNRIENFVGQLGQ